MRQILVILLFWICWLPPAFAAVKRLAVLEFTGIGIDSVVLGVVSDSARTGVVKVIDTDEILVMTRESVLEVLKDMGKDISCLQGACEVEVGRNIGADYIITGSVVQIGEEYVLTLNFLDTHSGALLASETMDATDINVLRKATPDLAQDIVITALKLDLLRVEEAVMNTSEQRSASVKEERGYSAVLIPKGEFLMGCTDGQGRFCQGSEYPVHQVKISRDFYMMESEVTQKLYKEVMGNNPSPISSRRKFFPVTKVKWIEAVKFANELSRLEGLELCYSIDRWTVKWENKACNGWRLPTEAEWEYAARGGKDLKYADSNWFRRVAHGGIFSARPIAVCSKNKNAYGLCDMSGNVQEWTWDKYKRGTYRINASKDVVLDPVGPNAGFGRVTRGGGIRMTRFSARVSQRMFMFSFIRSPMIGFRLVRKG